MITNQRCTHWCYRPLNFLIADRLLERNLTLAKLAQQIGMPEHKLRRFVIGDRAINERRFVKLMDLLGLAE